MKLTFSFLFLFLFAAHFLSAQTPELWGTASLGGTNGIGTIMKINGDGTGFQRIYSFTNGSQQSTLLPAGGSLLYGNTVSGGVGSAIGSIFSYNSSTGVLETLFSFDTLSGYYPRTNLIPATDGKYYSNTNNGGLYNDGTLFRFDPSTNLFEKLHDFNDTADGKYPVGDLFMASNGKLYGMTSGGGSLGGSGVIYSYALSGGTFAVEHEFNFSDGFSPLGCGFVEQNGLLYGMTFGGGSLGHGVIFTFNLSTGAQNVVYNFNGADGSVPRGVLLKASNGLFYGITTQGGTDNDGVLFSFNPINNAYAVLHDFEESTGNQTNGSLMQASDGNLYGMTQGGGANNFGVIFSYNIGTGNYAKLHDCNITDGALPYGELIEYSGITGIVKHESEESYFSVYPNPVNELLFFDAAQTKEAIVCISDIAGKPVIETSLWNTEPLDLSSLMPGTYLLRIITEEKTITKKLLKE